MKKIFFCFFMFAMFASLPVHAVSRDQDQKQKQVQQDIDSIEMIEGIPQGKSYQKIQPVWASANSMSSAIKKAKKQALKVGADAIIDTKMETKMASAGSATWTFGMSVSKPQPVVTGWAIKWAD